MAVSNAASELSGEEILYLLDQLLVVLGLGSWGLESSLSSNGTLSETIAQISA
jgi:hypothetical protein